MVMHFWLRLFNCILVSSVIANYEHVKEMGFKFWLDPNLEECYHELLEEGSRLYFMYDILNVDTHQDSIIAYFRNAYTRSIVAVSKTQRGHLELTTNETTLIDICMGHENPDTYVKYISVYFHIYHVEKALAKIKESEHFYNTSIDFHNVLDSITHHIIILREYQMERDMTNQKDSYLIEANLFWINRWASIHIVVIVSCFLFQTYFIKSLFKTSRK
ncbi:unnamed protein product [Rotaria socialis]|uniref:GOLD domain-containing protein n=2 Tax=Rotaria socialis TaxID=392032 RepID=A0A818ICN5_9BILA|nr:unnamed protein product [Rotaria socialis]CAF3533913.1 unnamed protein product [Rotaria socialis]CAF3613201.1 unnamed protein product [Rotaria socialis]